MAEPFHKNKGKALNNARANSIGISIGIGGLKSDGLAAPTVRTEKTYPA